jgi:hypothetical protein
MGIAVLVRPTNALVLLPAFCMIGFNTRALWAATAGLPFAAMLGLYNLTIYGHPLASGYGNWSESFSSANAAHNTWPIAKGLVLLFTPFVLGIVLTPFAKSARNRVALILGLWVAVLTCCYLFYYHTGETWWYFRFLLPAAPAALLLAATGLQSMLLRIFDPQRSWVKGMLLTGFAACLAWQVGGLRHFKPAEIVAGERHYRDTADWARAHLPADAVVYCMQNSSALHYYVDHVIARWDHMPSEQHKLFLQATQAQRRPIFAALFPFEEAEAFARIGGRWEKLATVGPTTFYRLTEPHP